jgi:hypothetical protein
VTASRAAAALWALLAALVLQTSVLPHLAVAGLVPGVVLIVVVVLGLRHGAELAMGLGFGAGLLLDLVPPADHVAGRWALALLLAGYLAGHVAGRLPGGLAEVGAGRGSGSSLRPDPGQIAAAAAVVAGCSFVANSCFALTGLVLRDPLVGIPEAMSTVAVTVALDLVVGALLVPWLLALDGRLESERLPA